MQEGRKLDVPINYHGQTPADPPGPVPLLEELLARPILRTEGLSAETMATVRSFRVPVLPKQIARSLAWEFGRRIVATRTDWGRFEDPLPSYAEAAESIKRTLVALGNRSRQPDKTGMYSVARRTVEGYFEEGRENERWIREECQTMLREIETGDYSRWTDFDKLVSRAGELTETQRSMVMPAVDKVASNPDMHPLIKREVLSHIVDVIIEGTAAKPGASVGGK